jgi:tetratricopeptide (TPR) repeat protein
VGDVFQLQDEISDAAARSLRVALSRDARLRSGGTVNLEAYTLLLQANHFQDRTNQSDNEKAIGLYRDAIALDPDYAQAWCRLGEAYVTQLGFSWAPFVESGRNARAALQRALEIDPDLARAHYLLGQIHRKVDWDWDRASAEYRRALEIDPQDLRSRAGMTIIEVLRGRFQEHTQVREEMIRRDPLDLDSIAYLGWVYYYAGRNDDAVREFRKLAGLAPYYASAQAMLGLTLALQGHGEEGLETLRKDSSARARDELLPVVLWKLGRKAESTAALDNAKMLYPTGSSFNMALSHAYRGERDAAFEWLEKAYRERDPGILWLRIEPPFDSLRGDPRYVDLLRRLHLDG